ncbi:MAG: isoprenylcysteine carboxylmethyltransferase family protein [Streptosporangiaceae bacterium]
MKPYFETSQLAGVLLLIVTMGWGAMELSHASNTRDGATRAGGGGRRLTVTPVIIAASVMLYLAPRIVPAAIRPGAAAFAAGMAVLLGGLVLRGWSIKTLGGYFTGRVMGSAGQPVITAGPYRLLRHPAIPGCCWPAPGPA